MRWMTAAHPPLFCPMTQLAAPKAFEPAPQSGAALTGLGMKNWHLTPIESV
jgi:hypothetical protein